MIRPDDTLDVKQLQQDLADFAAARDWGRYHSPKNLAMALAGEAGELAAVLQWLTEEESRDLRSRPADWEAFRAEWADVLMYLVRLADVAGLDMGQAVRDKMAVNAARYPVHLSRGRHTKYTSLSPRKTPGEGGES